MLFTNLKVERERITNKDHAIMSEIVYQGLPIVIENDKVLSNKTKDAAKLALDSLAKLRK